MRNFEYAIGDPSAGVAVLVDPAYRPLELVGLVGDDGLEVVGALATHYHPDHAGGEMMGRRLDGVAELVAARATPVHVQRDEVEWMTRVTGLDEGAFVAHDGGDVLMVGDVAVSLVHTPGHTPGSQCLLVQGRLVSGDTLFLQGCGRTDLPGSDAREMYRSLHQRLGTIEDDVVVYPGHLYAPEGSASLGSVRATNPVLAPATEEQWLARYGS
ncbi:MAG: MBL fold metallo-hydrolase [Acidobacteriota bacterium]|nr:MBL fold metallo-hydrolase [Acidobacteriota bacterium]